MPDTTPLRLGRGTTLACDPEGQVLPKEPGFFSVIVPVYNGADTLPRCLQALQAQTFPVDRFEIIVVDDGSTDGSAEVARSFGAPVVSQLNAGPAAARNHGAKMARGDVLLFTDADCAPDPDWIERMAGSFEIPEVAGVKGIYRTQQRGLVARFVQAEYEDKYDRMRSLETIDFVDTYSAGYRTEVFWAFDGFDVSFPFAWQRPVTGWSLCQMRECLMSMCVHWGSMSGASSGLGIGRWESYERIPGN